MTNNNFIKKGTALLLSGMFGFGLLAMPTAAEASSNASLMATTPIVTSNLSTALDIAMRENAKQKYGAKYKKQLEKERKERERRERLERKRQEKERQEREERARKERQKYEKYSSHKQQYSSKDRNTAAAVGALIGYMVGKSGV